MKDHEIRELVNQLRDIAVEYRDTQQLRERIAHIVRAAIQSGNSAQPVTVPDGWIPVSERMPEFNDEVLAWHRHGYSLIAVYSTSKDPITYKTYRDWETDRKSTRLNSSHSAKSRMPSSA